MTFWCMADGSRILNYGDRFCQETRCQTELQINPNLADAYSNRGLAEYALGDRKSAITDLQQAASLFQQRGRGQGAGSEGK
ncbi:hypothetical protein [Nostoc sp.]|uniref:hypothetical protein n=1 Tax=Nostoc sp. TaxID=1180 RepID=UPI003FA5C8A7